MKSRRKRNRSQLIMVKNTPNTDVSGDNKRAMDNENKLTDVTDCSESKIDEKSNQATIIHETPECSVNAQLCIARKTSSKFKKCKNAALLDSFIRKLLTKFGSINKLYKSEVAENSMDSNKAKFINDGRDLAHVVTPIEQCIDKIKGVYATTNAIANPTKTNKHVYKYNKPIIIKSIYDITVECTNNKHKTIFDKCYDLAFIPRDKIINMVSKRNKVVNKVLGNGNTNSDRDQSNCVIKISETNVFTDKAFKENKSDPLNVDLNPKVGKALGAIKHKISYIFSTIHKEPSGIFKKKKTIKKTYVSKYKGKENMKNLNLMCGRIVHDKPSSGECDHTNMNSRSQIIEKLNTKSYCVSPPSEMGNELSISNPKCSKNPSVVLEKTDIIKGNLEEIVKILCLTNQVESEKNKIPPAVHIPAVDDGTDAISTNEIKNANYNHHPECDLSEDQPNTAAGDGTYDRVHNRVYLLYYSSRVSFDESIITVKSKTGTTQFNHIEKKDTSLPQTEQDKSKKRKYIAFKQYCRRFFRCYIKAYSKKYYKQLKFYLFSDDDVTYYEDKTYIGLPYNHQKIICKCKRKKMITDPCWLSVPEKRFYWCYRLCPWCYDYRSVVVTLWRFCFNLVCTTGAVLCWMPIIIILLIINLFSYWWSLWCCCL